MPSRFDPDFREVPVGRKIAREVPLTNDAVRELRRLEDDLDRVRKLNDEQEKTGGDDQEAFERISDIVYRQLSIRLIYDDGGEVTPEEVERGLGWEKALAAVEWLNEDGDEGGDGEEGEGEDPSKPASAPPSPAPPAPAGIESAGIESTTS